MRVLPFHAPSGSSLLWTQTVKSPSENSRVYGSTSVPQSFPLALSSKVPICVVCVPSAKASSLGTKRTSVSAGTSCPTSSTTHSLSRLASMMPFSGAWSKRSAGSSRSVTPTVWFLLGAWMKIFARFWRIINWINREVECGQNFIVTITDAGGKSNSPLVLVCVDSGIATIVIRNNCRIRVIGLKIRRR